MSNAQAAIDTGSTHLLAFNEPDLWSQGASFLRLLPSLRLRLTLVTANMAVTASVAGWKAYMSPFVGKAKLVSPAVTNVRLSL
jgi:hypothetical protein